MVKKTNEEPALEKIVEPIFQKRDLIQVIIGATLLAIPIGFTEETWLLANSLPLINTLGFLGVSIFFISMFTFYHYHHHRTRKHDRHLVRRIALTYALSFLVVAILLTLIQQAPWTTNVIVALKRTIIVTFPASMSAAIADTIK